MHGSDWADVLFLAKAADPGLGWHFGLSSCCPDILLPSEAGNDRVLVGANRCCAIDLNVKLFIICLILALKYPFKKYPQALFSTSLTAVEMLCFPSCLVTVTSKDISYHPAGK